MSNAAHLAVFALVDLFVPAAPPPLAAITLVWVDPAGRVPEAAEGAMQEVVSLLRSAGAEVRWRRSEEPMLLAEGELAVIVLEAPWDATRRVMGSTPLAGPAPAVWIHPEAVASTMGLGALPSKGWMPLERWRFARALGRVAAHEVVHAVLGSPRHAAEGLMSRSLQREQLLAPRLAVDGETRRALADPWRRASR